MRFSEGYEERSASNFVHISGKIAGQTLEIITQEFGKESMSHAWEVQSHRHRKKKGEIGQEQSQEHAHHFL
jgi:hypothetical protein